LSSCRKCAKKRKGLAADFGLLEDAGTASASISFSDNRILDSVITGITAYIKQDSVVLVYVEDLYQWILSGVSGVNFVNVAEEAEFLTDYPDIKPYHYA